MLVVLVLHETIYHSYITKTEWNHFEVTFMSTNKIDESIQYFVFECRVFRSFQIYNTATNERHCISNDLQLACLFNSLLRLTTDKTSKFRITGPLWGASAFDKEPIMRKAFPCHVVCMNDILSLFTCFEFCSGYRVTNGPPFQQNHERFGLWRIMPCHNIKVSGTGFTKYLWAHNPNLVKIASFLHKK